MKELLDNALDASGDDAGEVEVGWIAGAEGRGVRVSNPGPGISGTDEEIASLLSIGRPLRSSKLLRLPTRGALGNGLRVVAGAVLASAGSIAVHTARRSLRLEPRDDGTTSVIASGPWSGSGTEIEVVLGSAVPEDEDAVAFAASALDLLGGTTYRGRTSAAWYDTAAFFELTQAARGMSARALVEQFEGFAGAKAGALVDRLGLLNRPATSLDRGQAEALHAALVDQTRPVKPGRLGRVGRGDASGYAVVETSFEQQGASIPCVIEVWAEINCDEDPSVECFINRSPILAPLHTWVEKQVLSVFGCGLCLKVKVGRAVPDVRMNIQTPHMPITSDGKEPNLDVVKGHLGRALDLAITRAKRATPAVSARLSQKDLILEVLPEAITEASGDGLYLLSQRQLFYAVRPALLVKFGKEPSYDYFCQVLTEYEAEEGEIAGMYRDDRGTVYHPHTGELIPLGTRSVAGYERPAFTFNKILYIEKEGFFEQLREARWPERHDCALLTSKGQPTRAARDLFDALGETEEEIQFFCVHDADAAGTIIFQSLQEATKARPGRTVRVVNLGLDPREAVELGLQVEKIEGSGRRRPVAANVEDSWGDWLQESRVELNAMTGPEFVAWLDAKMEEHGFGKVIPPPQVMADALQAEVEDLVREEVVSRILADADAEAQVAARMTELRGAIAEPDLEAAVPAALERKPDAQWRDPIRDLAVTIAAAPTAINAPTTTSGSRTPGARRRRRRPEP